MTKFCPNCGKPVTDDITKICSNCGTDLTNPGLNEQHQNFNRITSTRSEIFEKAIPFFATKKYAIQTQTDYLISFESQDRDVNWIIFVIFCCCGLIPAAIYYYWFTHKHQITISLSGATDVHASAIGNTDQAKKDAAEFMKMF
ncbi:MAG: zinc ribbon domain-containing protein [Methanoregula sp.]